MATSDRKKIGQYAVKLSEVESGIPMPRAAERRNKQQTLLFPWDQMKVGDSFEVSRVFKDDTDFYARISKIVRKEAAVLGYLVNVRTISYYKNASSKNQYTVNVLRVWRMA